MKPRTEILSDIHKHWGITEAELGGACLRLQAGLDGEEGGPWTIIQNLARLARPDWLTELVEHRDDYLSSFKARDLFRLAASYAIPGEEAVQELAEVLQAREVLEVGAGSGLWAALLNRRGLNVDATDADELPWLHRYHPVVHLEAVAAVEAYREAEVLFLCWPPYAEPMADAALGAFQGDGLVYIGEGAGGCTGDDAFHEQLREKWRRQAEIQIPQWPGLHDYITIYERK